MCLCAVFTTWPLRRFIKLIDGNKFYFRIHGGWFKFVESGWQAIFQIETSLFIGFLLLLKWECQKVGLSAEAWSNEVKIYEQSYEIEE